MFSQLRKRLEDGLDAVEQLAAPIPTASKRSVDVAPPSPRPTTSSLQARLGNAVKAPARAPTTLEERLKFAVGDASGSNSRATSPIPPLDPAQVALPPSPTTEDVDLPASSEPPTVTTTALEAEKEPELVTSPTVAEPFDAEVYADPQALQAKLADLRQRMQGFEAVLLQYPSLSSPDALRLYLQTAQVRILFHFCS
jgi:hypothetical protein